MIFSITRVSHYDCRAPESPCEGATRIDDGTWVIELDTLDQLVALENRVGPIIVEDDSITIYDDHIE